MQANPDKFQVLAVGKKNFDKNMKICVQNSTLSCEETVKLLGIKISLIKTLKSRGAKIDPWGTPFWMSAQLLRILLILICCFLFDK
jgi:hypothetical protein